MDAICKMSKEHTTWPCSARACPLFGDCYIEYEKAIQKPQTNADRIRAMSDEELAAKIAAMCDSSKCMAENGSLCPLFQDCPMGTMGVRGETWLDWLRQPVKDGDTDG